MAGFLFLGSREEILRSRSPYSITPTMASIVANAAAPPVVITPSQGIFRGVLVSILAMIGQRGTPDVLRSVNSNGPLLQFFGLNSGIGFPMALSAKRSQVVQVVGSAQPQRDDVMNVQSSNALSRSNAFLKLLTTILASVPISIPRPRCLFQPIRAGVGRWLDVFMNPNANGSANRQSVGAATIGTEVLGSNLRLSPLKSLSALGAGQFQARNDSRITLAFIRAIKRRSITMIGVVDRTAMSARPRWVFALWAGSHSCVFYPIFPEVC